MIHFLKMLFFVEILALIMTLFMHLVHVLITGKDFPLIIYPIILIVVLFASLMARFIAEPLSKWLM